MSVEPPPAAIGAVLSTHRRESSKDLLVGVFFPLLGVGQAFVCLFGRYRSPALALVLSLAFLALSGRALVLWFGDVGLRLYLGERGFALRRRGHTTTVLWEDVRLARAYVAWGKVAAYGLLTPKGEVKLRSSLSDYAQVGEIVKARVRA
jgi:hypothetical protein